MKYSLNLAEDGRVLSATLEKFGPDGVLVESLPDGNLYDYKYINGEFIHDPLPPVPPPDPNAPTQMDIIEAQVSYTAMMTDTVLEVQ